VRLRALRLVNFRQHADTAIEFDGGLTGIIGPNGSGKTTLLEAIAFALYGVDAARGTRESIRFSRAPARTPVKVDLDFDLGGHRYRVVRSLTSAEVYLDGAEAPIASSITAVTELLRRRLGMTRAEFFHTYFSGQKELDVLAAMAPSDRGRFLSRVLGYDRLRVAQARVREERKVISGRADEVQAAMPDALSVAVRAEAADGRLRAAESRALAAGARRRETEAELGGLIPRWETAQRERDRARETESELRLADQEAAQLVREAERVEAELAQIATHRAERDGLRVELSPFAGRMAELQRLDQEAQDEGRRQALIDGERSAAEEIARMRGRRGSAAGDAAAEAGLTTEAARLRGERDEAQRTLDARREEHARDRQEAETRREDLRKQWVEVKEQRERLVAAGEDGICPICARPLGGHYRTVLDLLDSQLEAVRVDGAYFKQRVEQLEATPDDITALAARVRALGDAVTAADRQVERARAAVRTLAQLDADIAARESRRAGLAGEVAALPSGYDAARHAEVRREVERLTPLDQRAARLSALVDREPQQRRERERIAADAARVAERRRELEARRAAARFSETDFAALAAAHERALLAAREAERAALAAAAEVTEARLALEAAEAARVALVEQEKRLGALRHDRLMHDELDRALNELRHDLNDALRPELSELGSAFLSDLTDGRYSALELDDQYNLLVLEDGIPKPVISGGEEDLANLVLRLAISQMIAERAGQEFSLLILDEVFASLDEVRRQNVVDLLRSLRDRFEQVIVITHVESVAGLDQVFTVRLDQERGCSVVTGGEAAFAGAGPGDDGGDLMPVGA
jgi:DNA repair protein SbcC/Rad50